VSKLRIPLALRRQVAREALYRCGYCLSSEAIIGEPMEFDHIIPQSRGGRTEHQNLWLACSQCNDFKSDRVQARDSITGRLVRFFNPRRDDWNAHFRWVDGGLRIEGTTPIGRATVAALRLNQRVRVTARRAWVIAGWHPPRA
jgi:HNH endonuclease